MVQRLRPHGPSAGPGFHPAQEAESHMLQGGPSTANK